MPRVNHTRYAVASAALAGALLLGACSSDDSVSESPVSDSSTSGSTATVDADALAGASALDGDLLNRFSSCDDVAPAVAPYIEGLILQPSSTVDEFGVLCLWETPDSATSLAEIRSVEIVVAPSAGPVPTASDLGAGGLVPVPDAAVEEAGGIAYTLDEAIAVAAVSVTHVQLPDVEVSISGGRWGDAPALDAPAAVAVAKQLLGL